MVAILFLAKDWTASGELAKSINLDPNNLNKFVNPLMEEQYGVDSMPETGENVAEEFGISRADQDAFALRSQQRAAAAIASGRLRVPPLQHDGPVSVAAFSPEISPLTRTRGKRSSTPRLRAADNSLTEYSGRLAKVEDADSAVSLMDGG